jgi:hypothetical protein
MLYFSTLVECKDLAGFCYQCINDCNHAAGFRKSIMLKPFLFPVMPDGTSVGLGGSLFFGEPPWSVPSYYYFLKEPLSKVLDFFLNSEPPVKVNVFLKNCGRFSSIRL